MTEWSAVHVRKPSATNTREMHRWAAPETGWVKANADGTVSRNGGNGAGGLVLRGDQGDFRAAACNFFAGVADAETTELMACRRAVELASEINVEKLHLETDSKVVASMLGDTNKNLSASGPLVEEIKQMLSWFNDVKVSSV